MGVKSMLRRQYQVLMDKNSDDLQFMIRNTDASVHEWLPSWYPSEIDEPSAFELDGSSLGVFPVDLHTGEVDYEVWPDFRKNFSSDFKDSPLPPEILDALCAGRSNDWRIIRCIPKMDETFFMVVNPTIIKNMPDEKVSWADSLEEQLLRGCVWASLSGACRAVMIIAPGSVCPKSYAIVRPSSSRFIFVEYNEAGPWRYSEVEEDSDIIKVMEFI